MLNKYLQRSVELEPVESVAEVAGAIELEYYLVESDIDDLNEFAGKKTFGIEIVKKMKNDFEVETIKNLSLCRENAVEVLKKLAANTVTPTGLAYVIDDMMGM